MSGGPGARLASVLSIRVTKDKLLKRLPELPELPQASVRLGIDDFSLRKGDSYATILADLEERRPVDVLPGRNAEPLATQLHDHPEIEVICRDRAGACPQRGFASLASGGRLAPLAQPGRAVEKTVGAHHPCIPVMLTTAPAVTEPAAASRRRRSPAEEMPFAPCVRPKHP
jgi:hypothetical protein